ALPSNTIPNTREDIKVITTWSGITLAGSSAPSPNPSPSSKEVERDPKPTMNQVHISSSESTARVPSSIIQPAPTSSSNEILRRNPHQPPIPYPSSKLEECLTLADLGASINLMPLYVWKKLMLLELTSTRMTLELTSRSVAYPAGIFEDVFMQVGKITFLADFIVVDYDIDPHVPLILGRPFLRTARALVDVYREEFTFRSLKMIKIKTTKSSNEEPPKLELKDLPSHIEYAFLKGTSKLPIIIAKDLKREENDQLIKTPSLDNILSLTNRFEDILGGTTNSDESNGEEADIKNMETAISASLTPTLRIHKDHPKSQIIGPVDTPIQTRNKSKETLVDCPKGVRPIGTKWVIKNKKDERGIIIRNKARLVGQGHTQEEGIDYDEVFAPVARIEAIRLSLAYASFMGFIVYQMVVKSAFLYGTIDFGCACNAASWISGSRISKGGWHFSLTRQVCRRYSQEIQIYRCEVFKYSHGQGESLEKGRNWKRCRSSSIRSMIVSLMYLTASRPDIMFAICACARHQVTPKESFSDSDYGGATQDRKSTSGGCQFLGRRLISWQCKKQTIVATSTTKAEYVAVASYCGQVL
nr:ribonuclease H-like domain-containing protein [Tanacetum cinerariifolium]